MTKTISSEFFAVFARGSGVPTKGIRTLKSVYKQENEFKVEM